MTMKQLRERYGGKTAVQAINAAIREEIPGGGELLQLIGTLYMRTQREPSRQELVDIYISLRNIRKKMEEAICQTYDISQERPKYDNTKKTD